jgi:hypothetical protein
MTTYCRGGLDCRRGVCVDPSVAGWPGWGQQCGGDASAGCSFDMLCESGVCVNRRAIGEPCEPGLFSNRVFGAFCDGASTPTCVERAREGEICNSALPCRAGLEGPHSLPWLEHVLHRDP